MVDSDAQRSGLRWLMTDNLRTGYFAILFISNHAQDSERISPAAVNASFNVLYAQRPILLFLRDTFQCVVCNITSRRSQ